MALTVFAVAVITITASPALAQRSDYQATSAKVELCKMAGQQGQRAWLAKQKELPMPVAGPDLGHIRPIISYANEYGYKAATDQRDADRNAWSYCMDNLDRLARDENARRGRY